MANAFDLITKYSSKAWDKVYKAESRSALLDADKDLLKFTGVKTVKIAKFQAGGLSDYRRANDAKTGGDYSGFTAGTTQGYGYGYNQADAALVWEEFTISCDRAAQFRVELFDDEETDGLAVAATTTDVSRVSVIPEVDAYCFSKIVEYAGKVDSTSYGTNPLQALNAAFKALEDEEVPEDDQIIFCSTKFRNDLRNSSEITKFITQADYDKNIKFTIEKYEGRDLVVVPPRRFRTLIDLKQGGYAWKSGSYEIDFIVCAKSAIYHVTKYDKVRVFSPQVVQDFDGYKINIRVYHDVFVPDNKRPAIYVHTSNNAQVGYNLQYTFDATSKKFTGAMCLGCQDLIKYYAVADGDAGYAGLAVGGDVPSTSATCLAITIGTTALTSDTWKLVAVGNNGKIVAINDTTIVVA